MFDSSSLKLVERELIFKRFRPGIQCHSHYKIKENFSLSKSVFIKKNLTVLRLNLKFFIWPFRITVFVEQCKTEVHLEFSYQKPLIESAKIGKIRKKQFFFWHSIALLVLSQPLFFKRLNLFLTGVKANVDLGFVYQFYKEGNNGHGGNVVIFPIFYFPIFGDPFFKF